MSRIEWSRRTADEVETLIGIALCRENPDAIRIRPSQGDRGVDIYVQADGLWTVYQVKSFTGPLTSSQKRQITKSWDRFRAFESERGLKMRAWYLVRPENPTHEDEGWLAKLTAVADYPCAWRGLDFCDRLAADHPSVIDYYLFDGKERLQEAVTDLLSAAGIGAEMMSEPIKSQATLESIHRTINLLDPHFRYDFRVDTVAHDDHGKPILPDIPPTPGLVAATIRSDGQRAVTFAVIARFRDAVAERPVPGRFTLVAEPGTTEAKAIEDFVEYGITATGIPAKDLGIDLPGGLGVSEADGTVTIGPAQVDSARSVDLRLAVLEEQDDVEVASVDLMMDPPTTGLRGQKIAIAGRERNGVFDVTIRLDPESGRLHFNARLNNVTHADPTDVLQGLYLLSVMKQPRRIQLRIRNGPALSEPMPVPDSFDIDVHNMLRACEALSAIQAHSFEPITVPDLSQVTIEEAEEWSRAARLLRGDSVSIIWNHVSVHLAEGAPIDTAAFTVATVQPLTVTIAGHPVALGYQLIHLEAARVDPTQPESATDEGAVRLVPAASNQGSVRWIGHNPPAQENLS